MTAAGLTDTSKKGPPDGPELIVVSNIQPPGKFGFVEFRTVAEATSCLALNNIEARSPHRPRRLRTRARAPRAPPPPPVRA